MELPLAPAPAGFADRVMARVEASAAVRANLLGPGSAPAFDWWVRAAAEPAVVLALALAGLMLWKRDAVLAAFSGALVMAGQLVSASPRMAPSIAELHWLPVLSPIQSLGLAMVVAPALALVSLSLYRWTERLAARPSATIRVRPGPAGIHPRSSS